MDWPTVITQIITAGLSILSVYLGFRLGKNAAFREKVFDKRIEAHMEIMELAGMCRDRAHGLKVSQHLLGSISKDTHLDFLALREQLEHKHYRWSMFLSPDVNSQLVNFQLKLRALISYHADRVEPHLEELEHVDPAFFALDEVVRASVGTDRITQEINRSLSGPLWLRIWRRS